MIKKFHVPFILAFLASPLSAADGEVTFAEHIAPIIYNNCTICHREGEIGPIPLTNYDEIAAQALSIKIVTQERIMPPWPPDRDFSRFVGERALTEEQIELIAEWADTGSTRGSPEDEPPLPDFPKGSVLGEPDLTLTVSEAYTIRGDGRDEYRVFVLPTGLTEDKDVVAVEFRPGNRQIVHHALLTFDTTGQARVFDAQDPASGYSSFGGFGVPARDGLAYPGWVPGAIPRFFPPGTGLKLPAGADLLVQIHFAPWPIQEDDQSSVNLFFGREPIERVINTRVMLPSDLVDDNGDHFELSPLLGQLGGALIAAGVEEFLGETITQAEAQSLARNATLDTVFGDQLGGTVAGFLEFDIAAGSAREFRGLWNVKKDISLLNVWPHMHYLGRNWEIYLQRPDSSTVNLIRIPDWNFNWQGSYTFPTYIKAPQGSIIYASARYDNTIDNPYNPNTPPKDIGWGEKTTDEMYFLPFAYVDYREGDENLPLDNLGPGDLPAFRIDSLTADEIYFRLQVLEDDYVIEHSTDLRLWQRVTVSDATVESPEWIRLTVPRGVESAGFYRAVIFRGS